MCRTGTRSLSTIGCAAVLAVLMMVLAVTGCARSGSTAGKLGGTGGPLGGVEPQTISVQAVVVTEGILTTTNETSGTVQPTTESKVAARAQGTVWKIYCRAGDWVKAGEKVIQLDDTQLKIALKTAQSNLAAARIDLSTNEDTTSQATSKLEAQVRSAQAALAAAQKNYDAQKALLEVGGATGTQVDTAQSDLQTAQANLQAAQTALDQNRKAPTQSLAQLRIDVEKAENSLNDAQVNLQYATITAPFAGQISEIPVNPGEYVQPSAIAFTLVSADREIHFNVPPAQALHLPVGSRLTFTYEGVRHDVAVKQSPSAPINGTVPMVAQVPSSYAPSFGSVGTVSYSLSVAQGILIPIAALRTSEDKNYVFVIADGKAVSTPITIIAESGITAAVTGVASGSQVIVNPPPGLLAGSAVQPVTTSAAKTTEVQSK